MTNTIFRTKKNRANPYVMIHQDLFADKHLSWEARGMLGYLLSKPDDWEVRFYDLEAQDEHSGRERTRRILSELGKAGYIRRRRERQPNGTFKWITTVYEDPDAITDETDAWDSSDGPTSDGSATTGSPTSGSATGGKPVDIPITDVPSTESPITESPTTDTPPPAKNPAPSTGDGSKNRSRRGKGKTGGGKLDKEQEQVRNRLMHVFLEYSEAPPPTSYAQRNKVWHPPLEEIARRCDWDGDAAAQLVKDAIAQMDKKGLEMKCPASILTVALGIKRRNGSAADGFEDAWREL